MSQKQDSQLWKNDLLMNGVNVSWAKFSFESWTQANNHMKTKTGQWAEVDDVTASLFVGEALNSDSWPWICLVTFKRYQRRHFLTKSEQITQQDNNICLPAADINEITESTSLRPLSWPKVAHSNTHPQPPTHTQTHTDTHIQRGAHTHVGIPTFANTTEAEQEEIWLVFCKQRQTFQGVEATKSMLF